MSYFLHSLMKTTLKFGVVNNDYEGMSGLHVCVTSQRVLSSPSLLVHVLGV